MAGRLKRKFSFGKFIVAGVLIVLGILVNKLFLFIGLGILFLPILLKLFKKLAAVIKRLFGKFKGIGSGGVSNIGEGGSGSSGIGGAATGTSKVSGKGNVVINVDGAAKNASGFDR